MQTTLTLTETIVSIIEADMMRGGDVKAIGNGSWCACFEVKGFDDIVVKGYFSEAAAALADKNQAKAAAHGLGPKVFGEVFMFNNGRTHYAYISQKANTQIGHNYVQIDKESANLKMKMIELFGDPIELYFNKEILFIEDIRTGNVGLIEGDMVCIDFYLEPW